jgi:hypothetical protein
VDVIEGLTNQFNELINKDFLSKEEVKVVSLLLEAGVNKDKRDEDGHPFMYGSPSWSFGDCRSFN